VVSLPVLLVQVGGFWKISDLILPLVIDKLALYKLAPIDVKTVNKVISVEAVTGFHVAI